MLTPLLLVPGLGPVSGFTALNILPTKVCGCDPVPDSELLPLAEEPPDPLSGFARVAKKSVNPFLSPVPRLSGAAGVSFWGSFVSRWSSNSLETVAVEEGIFEEKSRGVCEQSSDQCRCLVRENTEEPTTRLRVFGVSVLLGVGSETVSSVSWELCAESASRGSPADGLSSTR